MYAYIARQPIFNTRKKIEGYELLYRDGNSGNVANFKDGDVATRYLLSDAITRFGLASLANQQPAYINFTQNLILNDFVKLAPAAEVVIELLEDITFSDRLIDKVKELKNLGYTLAVDDYAGHPRYNEILPLVDIVKVDFRLTNERERFEIAERLKKLQVVLLAEKVETIDEFNAAVDMGYTLFQGYFFEKPRIFRKKIPTLSTSSYGRILSELQKANSDFDMCAKIIHSDAVMTYMLMQKMHSLTYYRGNLITGIRHALVMMGMTELRRWIILLLARENNITQSDELVRAAYLRGLFIEQLMSNSPLAAQNEKGFLLGMFSMLDKILGIHLEDLLGDIGLDDQIRDALLGKRQNAFSYILQYAIVYEMANPNLLLPDIGLTVNPKAVAHIYMNCIVETDRTFNSFGGSYR